MNAIKIFKTVLPFAAIVLLSGCPAVPPRSLEQPEELAVHGAYLHKGSNIKLPESVGVFQREMLTRYDANGLDVSAGYDLVTPSNHIAATVYVYPAPRLVSIGSPPDVIAEAKAHLAESEFERRQREIHQVHPDAMLIEQHDTVRTEDGLSYPGKMAIYEYEDLFAGSRQILRSELYVFCYIGGKWAVEYRITRPKAEQADQQIQQFIDNWNWY